MPPRITEAQHLAILGLRDLGWSYAEIAGKVGIAEETARRYCLGENGAQHVAEHRCPGCRAIIKTPTCLLCGLRAGTVRERVISEAHDPDDVPDEAEVAARAKAIRDAEMQRMQTFEYASTKVPRRADDKAGIREYGFTTRHNGRVM